MLVTYFLVDADFCKQLSKKEAEGLDASSSASDIDSDDGKEKAFHHPFQIKERPSSIVMNIRVRLLTFGEILLISNIANQLD